jgi:hypothetical protein
VFIAATACALMLTRDGETGPVVPLAKLAHGGPEIISGRSDQFGREANDASR